MIGPVTGRIGAISTMHNSAFNWMNSANALISMTGNAANQSPAVLHAAEKKLLLSMHNDSLMYRIAELQDETYRKLEKDNIKRSFSTFA